MDVSIQPSPSSIILYPDAEQDEGRKEEAGRIKGFIEFKTKTDYKVTDFRFRILGHKRIVKDANNALDNENDDASKQFPQTFFLQNVKMLDIHTGKEIDIFEHNLLTKGKHVFAFDGKVPNHLPSTHHHTLSKVNYELVFHIRARPHRNFFKLPFMFTKSVPILIGIHPSRMGENGLNNINCLLKSQSDDEDIMFLIQSDNARLGGCMNLSIFQRGSKGEQISVSILNMKVELGQRIFFRGQELQFLEKRCLLVDMPPILSEFLNQEKIDNFDTSHSSTSRPNSDEVKLRPIKPEFAHYTKVKAWLPRKEQNISKAAPLNTKEFLTDWHPSTPLGTNDEIRTAHFIEAIITLENTLGQERSIVYNTGIMLVDEDYRTATIQLPDYSSAIGCHERY